MKFPRRTRTFTGNSAQQNSRYHRKQKKRAKAQGRRRVADLKRGRTRQPSGRAIEAAPTENLEDFNEGIIILMMGGENIGGEGIPSRKKN